MKTQRDPAHKFNLPGHKTPVRCWCDLYHYRCACGNDCTQGTRHAPAHRDIEGVTRCRTCNEEHERKQNLLHRAAAGLLKAVVACLNAAPSLDHTSAGILARAAIAEAAGIQPDRTDERPRLVVTVRKGLVAGVYSDTPPDALPLVVVADLDGVSVGQLSAPVLETVRPLIEGGVMLRQLLAAHHLPAVADDVECGACGWQGDETEMRCALADVPDLLQRISPGETVPAGECPQCGALVHIVKP